MYLVSMLNLLFEVTIMKKWTAASIEELNISQTAYGWFGNAADGGRFGDGTLSGHAKWVSSSDSDDSKGDDSTQTGDSTDNNNTDLAS